MKYLTGGGGFVIGFRSGDYSAQLRLSYYGGLVYRVRKSGVWENWETSVLNSDLEKINVRVNAVANTSVEIPNAPITSNYIAQTTSISGNRNHFFDIVWDGKWYIFTDYTQAVTVTFYKYPV